MKNKRNVFKVLDVVIGSAILSSLFVLLNATGVYADVVDTVTVTVPVSCSMTSIVNTEHTTSINVGTYEDEIGETTFKVLCNDANGFAVYAIGYSNDEYGNTTMKPATLPDSNGIVTGTATSGSTSNWAMKLTAVSGDFAPTLATGFDAYHAVPAEYTKVVSLGSSTDATVGPSFKSTYAAFVSQSQAADTYTGKVKYTIVHPSDAVAPITPDAVMQNMNSSECTSTPINVIDNRDDHVYVAQRLADGNCWMMENLDLGRTDLTTDLTSANTNLSTTISAAAFNSWKTATTTQTTSNGEFIPVDGSDTVSGTAYGTLYNYYAASAGTISGSTNSSNASYDICPAGWRLPTGGSTGEFSALYSNPSYNTVAKIRAPISQNGAAFAFAGRFYGAGPIAQGSFGYYWSSTRYNDASMNSIRINTSYFFGNDYVNRSNGYAIRCILNEPKTISKITFLQDFNNLSAADKATVIESMEENTAYELIDNRDSHAYDVAKLKDGKVWMVENLDLGRTSLTTNLTSANTNLATTVNATTFNGWKKTEGTSSYTAGEFIPQSGTDPTTGYSYGTLYNYCAVTAGTICSTSNSSSASYDICPAGWRLPVGGTTGEYKTLSDSYATASNLRDSIENGGAAIIRAAYFATGTPGEPGSIGYYWTSSMGDGTPVMYVLNISSIVTANTNGYRYSGYSVHCVAK